MKRFRNDIEYKVMNMEYDIRLTPEKWHIRFYYIIRNDIVNIGSYNKITKAVTFKYRLPYGDYEVIVDRLLDMIDHKQERKQKGIEKWNF